MTVEEMLERMSSREFSEWMAYSELQPFGEEREDYRAGSIAAPLLNLWSGKRSKKVKAKDWIHTPKQLQGEQNWEAMREMFKAVAKSYGDKDKDKES